MEHFSLWSELLRVVKFDDRVLVLLSWVPWIVCYFGKQLKPLRKRFCKWLKTITWTLNVTNHTGKLTIDFHAGSCAAPPAVSNTKCLLAPAKEPLQHTEAAPPKSASRKRSRALPSSDINADNS